MLPVRVAIAQTNPSIDAEANFATIEKFTAQAAAGGARLVVFPEEAALLADESIKPRMNDIARKVWFKFVDIVSKLSREYRLAIIAAGYEPNDSGLPYNTIVAYSSNGERIALYRKMHTYDAFTYQESEYVSKGSELSPIIDLEGIRVGIANCYDVRFPELFRSMADREVDVISLSAAWVAGKGKEQHWDVLTKARAIENVSWVLASGTVGSDSVGLSRVIDPLGVVVASANAHEESLIFAEVDSSRTRSARDLLPALKNRRIDLSYSVR